MVSRVAFQRLEGDPDDIEFIELFIEHLSGSEITQIFNQVLIKDQIRNIKFDDTRLARLFYRYIKSKNQTIAQRIFDTWCHNAQSKQALETIIAYAHKHQFCINELNKIEVPLRIYTDCPSNEKGQ